MNDNKSVAHRLGRVLEAVTRQSGRLPTTPEYGSWLLGKVDESLLRRRVRIQIILTTFIVIANLIGICVATVLVVIRVPDTECVRAAGFVDHVRRRARLRRCAGARHVLGDQRVIKNVRWAIEDRTPTEADQRNTFFAPWRLTRVLLFLWGVGTALLTVLYGLQDTDYIPKWLLGVELSGHRRIRQLLSVHRVRVASGGRAGAGGRASATAIRPWHHGPHHAGLGSRVRRPGARHHCWPR